jgi:hypothetical protein
VVRERPAGRYRLSPPLAAGEWLRRWTTHARWVEHGLPCLAPVAAYPRGRRSRIVTAIPAGAVRLAGAPDPAALGGLLGAVHDRGIGLPALAWSELWRGADGSLLLDAPVAMTLERADRTRPWEANLPWDWSALTPAARRAFVTAHARATRHSRAEREALEREGAGG